MSSIRLVNKLFMAPMLALMFVHQVWAQSWVKTSESSSRERVTELSKESIVKYQGIVIFTVRNRALEREKSSLVLYNRLFLICSTGEVWDVADEIEKTSSPDRIPPMKIHPGTRGPTDSEQNRLAGRHPLVTAACKRSNNRVSIEVPVARSTDGLYVWLPSETKIMSGLVSVWTKRYLVKSEPFKGPDGTPLTINGEVRFNLSVDTDADYTMFNWVSDCGRDESSLAAMYVYSSQGNIKDSNVVPRDRLSFSINAPQSVGKTIHDLTCSLK